MVVLNEIRTQPCDALEAAVNFISEKCSMTGQETPVCYKLTYMEKVHKGITNWQKQIM